MEQTARHGGQTGRERGPNLPLGERTDSILRKEESERIIVISNRRWGKDE